MSRNTSEITDDDVFFVLPLFCYYRTRISWFFLMLGLKKIIIVLNFISLKTNLKSLQFSTIFKVSNFIFQEQSASTSSTIDMTESTQICDNEIINLQNDREKSLLELVKPFEGVLDPDLLQSITSGIEDFMHHSITENTQKSSKEHTVVR